MLDVFIANFAQFLHIVFGFSLVELIKADEFTDVLLNDRFTIVMVTVILFTELL